MYKDIIDQRKRDFDNAFEFAKKESGAIRTGRASTSLVEGIQVEYMGSKLTVKELGTINIPEPRMIIIQPWDPGSLELIEKAIKNSSLGLNPLVDGKTIRLAIPPLTEERRKEFIKLLNQKMEEAKIKMRRVREEILKKVQNQVKEGVARDDEAYKAKNELQKIMDEFNLKIDELAEKKEKEIMS